MSYLELGALLIRTAPKHKVRDNAPNTIQGLSQAQGLIIWSGASENSIWGSKQANWAFRALHDALHLKTGMGFTVDEEIELGRIQASMYSGLLADLVFCEVSAQALHYKITGKFVENQVEFTKAFLKNNR